MPLERTDAHQAPVVGSTLAPDGAVCQAPGIDGMRFPHLGHLLARLLQTELLTQGFGLVAPQKLERGKLPDLLVEPVLADLKRREAPIPSFLAFLGTRSNILDHKHADREETAEEPGQAQFPLPSRFG